MCMYIFLLIECFPRTVLFISFQILFHSVQRSARNWKFLGEHIVHIQEA